MIKAVIGILRQQDQLFVVRRRDELATLPGYTSFPGGKVEAKDAGPRPTAPLLLQHPAELVRALCRELQEELCFDLEAWCQRGLVTDFYKLGKANTPSYEVNRFEVHFFMIHLKQTPPLIPAEGEFASAGWENIAQLAQNLAEGKILSVIPTIRLIQALAKDPKARHLDNFNLTYNPMSQNPLVDYIQDFSLLPVKSVTWPPYDSTNAYLLGPKDQPRLLVDPSPKDNRELDKLYRTLEGIALSGILITHHHQDHCQAADEMARHFDIPLLLHPECLHMLQQREGKQWSQGIEIKLVEEGDQVGWWNQERVRVLHTPGHAPGHLCLYPESLRWMLVADLVQSQGSVVIPIQGGNLKDYMASLERVMEINPGLIFCSHGAPQGGNLRLRQTWEHRKRREEEVFHWASQGLAPDQVLAQIYPDLEPKLLPLAMQNLQLHWQKLVEEGRLAQLPDFNSQTMTRFEM